MYPYLEVFFPLVGVIIGGLITYFTTRKIEKDRWEQQKKDKLLQDRREVLQELGKWIDPVRHAISGDIFRYSEWPANATILEAFSSAPLPSRFRIFVPEDLRITVECIVEQAEALNSLWPRLLENHAAMIAANPDEKAQLNADGIPISEESGHHLDLARSYVKQFDNQMQEAYDETYK